MGDPEGRMTCTLLCAIVISCVGNAFLYGWQIGVVNQPIDIIQEFYNKTFYERNGGNWETMQAYDDYLDAKNVTDEDYIKANNLNATGDVVLSLLGNATNNVAVKMAPNNKGNASNIEKRLPPGFFGADTTLLLEDWELKMLWSTTVAAFVLFGMIGAFCSAKVADFFGRKMGMIYITVIMFVAAILGGIPLAAKSPECLILSRVLVGLHSGLNITLCPLYLAEISPKRIRGAVGTCFQLFITIGILMSQIFGLKELLNTDTLWVYLFAFNAFPALICLIGLPFFPESPRYLLIKKGDETAAREALERFRGTDSISDEIEDMRQEASRSMGIKNYTIKELVTAPDLRMPVIIACVLQICQQWSGINAVMSYSTILFKLVSIEESQIPYVVVGTGVINVAMTVIAVPMMEKAGRRPLLLFPTVLMLISFVIMIIFLNLQGNSDYADYKQSFAYVCIIVMHTYIIGFALGLGPIPFIVVGEIFRQEPRAAAMSLSLAFNWICNFILMLTFPFLKDGMKEFVYLLFIVILIIALIFIFFFVPETKNRTFDEIANSISLGGRAGGSGGAYGVNADETEPMSNTKV